MEVESLELDMVLREEEPVTATAFPCGRRNRISSGQLDLPIGFPNWIAWVHPPLSDNGWSKGERLVHIFLAPNVRSDVEDSTPTPFSFFPSLPWDLSPLTSSRETKTVLPELFFALPDLPSLAWLLSISIFSFFCV